MFTWINVKKKKMSKCINNFRPHVYECDCVMYSISDMFSKDVVRIEILEKLNEPFKICQNDGSGSTLLNCGHLILRKCRVYCLHRHETVFREV